MLLSQMLYSPQLSAGFNPFEETELPQLSAMPGWQVTIESSSSHSYLCVAGVELLMHPAETLNESLELAIDHDTGKFFLKESIVRVDKNKGEVFFRNGESCRRGGLRPVELQPMQGFRLAQAINSFVSRIR
jgi:hypothetical protein